MAVVGPFAAYGVFKGALKAGISSGAKTITIIDNIRFFFQSAIIYHLYCF